MLPRDAQYSRLRFTNTKKARHADPTSCRARVPGVIVVYEKKKVSRPRRGYLRQQELLTIVRRR